MALDAAAFRYAAPACAAEALAALAPQVAAWFGKEIGEPTLAQRVAWPAIARGDHLLLSAPTGSGKTLAAMAPVLGALLDDPAPGVRCLYVAPLKALSRDVGKNLLRPLRSLRAASMPQTRGHPPSPRIRIALRTGDTPAGRRRRQVLRPPHILLTTPESLALLLAQAGGRAIFRSLRWVVVDEVHALASSKRGVDLTLSLERLAHIVQETHGDARDLQRIGLSATCAPLEEAGRFLVGAGRQATLAQVDQPAAMEILIEPLPVGPAPSRGFMARLLERLDPVLRANRTTLIFTNIRSIAERLTWALRRRYPRQSGLMGVHHSALAPQRRRSVERRLKQGKLRCVVSSTSLELGVDIGSVDQVVLIHPPGGAASLLQRLGRSGHRPGQKRRGLLLGGSPADLLESVVTAASSRAGQIESLDVPQHPLDVLCQHLAGMAMDAWWTPAEAMALVRRAHPYRDLADALFEQCLAYLSGVRRDGENWLLPRLRWQDGRFTISDDRTARLLRRNLGTILSEEARPVRLMHPPQQSRPDQPCRTEVGALDDFYAERLQPGDRFVLDGRCFEYRRREDRSILVHEVFGYPLVPRWTGHGWNTARELAQRVFILRLHLAEALREGEAAAHALLRRDYHLKRAARDAIIHLVRSQEACSEAPGLCTVLIEAVPTETGVEYYLHTPLNRAGNDALARVLLHRLTRRGRRARCVIADLGLMLSLESRTVVSAADWRDLLSADDFEAHLAEALADSTTLRERFARIATTGLMVLRHPFGRPRKVGGSSWAARRLFDMVRQADPDFVFLRQAEQELHARVCDRAAALGHLERLRQMAIHLRWLAEPSPFAQNWTQPAEMANHGE